MTSLGLAVQSARRARGIALIICLFVVAAVNAQGPKPALPKAKTEAKAEMPSAAPPPPTK